MTKLGSKLFRRKKKAAAGEAKEKAKIAKLLSKRIEALTEKLAALQMRLHDTSLAYLQLVSNRLKQKIRRRRPNPWPAIARRKLPRTVMMRMKRVASAMLHRPSRGKIVAFPRDNAATPDR
jgi:hypothetical protein